ncbi:putative leucine-rich repeat-containing protein DDB_G0290503 [Mytilus edulis]|uniref:putative leucine-rich repeat-containing protein DDB_G0290503 n=1 Tax=Mytilus edulis TaxID=6550 RepID=UPI0039EDF727
MAIRPMIIQDFLFEIADDKHAFTNKIPKKELFKSAVSITLDKQKLFVITIYYTTKKATIQGQGTSEWLQSEFKVINDTINKIKEIKQKGNLPCDVDNIFSELKFKKNELIDIESPEDLEPIAERVHADKVIDDIEKIHVPSENETQNETFKPNTSVLNNQEGYDQDKMKILESELEKIRSEQTRHKEEITQMKTTIHDLEIELVKQDTELQAVQNLFTNLQTNLNKIENMNEQIDKEKSLKIKKNEDRLKEMANKRNQEIQQVVKMKQNITELQHTIEKEVEKRVDERNQEIQRVIKIEQNIKELQHTIEKEAEEHVEDQTYHAETKTKNTKVHVESAVDNNSTPTERISEKKNSSSIIKDIDGKRLYKNRKVKVITLHDKTVFGAIQYIKSFRDKAKHIMFQIGSNDIEQKNPDEVIEEIEELVRVTQRYNPDATITFGEILPRVLSDRYYAKFFNEHRLIFNVQLYELCKDLDLHFVRYDFIQSDYFVDGIHIKGHGIPIMVMSIKRVLNTLLNVKLWENNEYNTKTNPVRNNGIPNYQMPNSIINRKQRDHQAFEHKSHFNNPIHVGSESTMNCRNKIVNMMELMLQEMRTENEISTFSMNGQIVLIGDLNARTGQRADFIVNDSDHINNFDGFDLLPENYITDSEININNQDTSVNTVGTKLLDLYKEISLEEKGWHWIKSCKWSENSKLKLIDALLTENVNNEIIEFEMVNYEENQLLENNIDFKAETDAPISCSEVNKVIRGLKLQKSAGPDRIINEIIKTSNQVIIKSIVKIFNLILETGIHPKSWKDSYIIALHKKGDKSDPNNYRGISLISNLPKIFNAVLNNRLITVVDKQLNNCQFGFRENHRTADSLEDDNSSPLELINSKLGSLLFADDLL